MPLLDAAAAADLVRRITQGEAGAETDLVRSCGRPLRFLARRHARHEADAEDLFQETLIVALQRIRLGEIQQPERLAAFLRSLVKNLATQRYRRRHHRAETSDAELPEAPDAHRPSPLDSVLQRERSHTAQRLLAELRIPRDREVLSRYYLGEETSTAICADLGIESDHFYRVLHRARLRYRQLWEATAAADA